MMGRTVKGRDRQGAGTLKGKAVKGRTVKGKDRQKTVNEPWDNRETTLRLS